MINFDFLKKSLGIVSPPQFCMIFQEKCFSSCCIRHTGKVGLETRDPGPGTSRWDPGPHKLEPGPRTPISSKGNRDPGPQNLQVEPGTPKARR